MEFAYSVLMRQRAHELIPGGAHTYARDDDQYPESGPAFVARGAGCHVWDVDGNEFIEYGMGLGGVALGHAYEPVVAAVIRQLPLGVSFTRPAPIELECAQLLLETVAPEGGRMVTFAKNGSDVTTAAVRLARAYTGRDLVGICADHPLFSTGDWSIGGTAMPAGVPAATREPARKFRYNDLDSARDLFAAHPGRIACLLLEVENAEPPKPGFLTGLRGLCDQHGALLIFDEISTGFRCHLRGAQFLHNVTADLTAYGKALANGFALAALVGQGELMRLGGLRGGDERAFLLSTTYAAETHAMAAAVAAISAYRREPVVEHLYRQGERLAAGVQAAAAARGVSGYFGLAGRPCNLVYVTRDAEGNRSQQFRTLFLQELLRRGVLAPSFITSYAHTDTDIDRTIEAVEGALEVYARALVDGVARHLSAGW